MNEKRRGTCGESVFKCLRLFFALKKYVRHSYKYQKTTEGDQILRLSNEAYKSFFNGLEQSEWSRIYHPFPISPHRMQWGKCEHIKMKPLLSKTAHNEVLNFLIQAHGQWKMCHWQSGAVTSSILGKRNPRPPSGLWAERELVPYVLFWNPDLQTYPYFGKQSPFKIGYGGKDFFPQTSTHHFPPPLKNKAERPLTIKTDKRINHSGGNKG